MEYRFPALLAGPTRKTVRLALRQPPVEPARFRITTLAAPALLAMLASGRMESLALFVHNVRRTVRFAALLQLVGLAQQDMAILMECVQPALAINI